MPGPIRTVVAGVGGAEGNEPVLLAAAQIADRAGAALHVVHAYSPPDASAMLGVPMAELTGAGAAMGATPMFDPAPVREGLRARLQELASGAGAGPREVHVEAGEPAVVLARVAEEVRADLVVVGTTDRGALERALLGSTSGRVLREVHAPVLVLRRPLSAAGGRVLLTTDLGEQSASACARALELAPALFPSGPPAIRCLFLAVPVPGDVPPPHGDHPEARAREELERFVAALPAPAGSVEPVVRVGAPADEIVAEADAWPADLVVLGTHGRTGLRHLFLGSVAESTVREVSCNALVIPPRA